MKADELYAKVTNDLIAKIEAGAGAWDMPWRKIGGGDAPRSVATGKPYKGINWWLLSLEGIDRGYMSPHWATFNQWKAQLPEGAQVVRKGEKAASIFLWKPTKRKMRGEDGSVSEKDSLFATTFSVFNAEQIVDPPAKFLGRPPELSDHERIEAADEFFGAIGANVQVGGDRAYYAPIADQIAIPQLGQFGIADHYYSTLAHEHVHWTGHPTRLDRQLRNRFGSEAYAAEELIAEIGAAFVGAQLGLDPAVRRDHAAYLQSWLTILRADPKAIVTAASQAQKAADFLVEAAAVVHEMEPA